MNVPALFHDLHDVAQVLTEHIRTELHIADVQPGPPKDVAAGTAPGVRITLLYVTPRPSHRNDPDEVAADGSRHPPPLSLSCFYLVTTSGADSEDPVAAYSTLGRIMTLYHDSPVLLLPLSELGGVAAGTFSALGEGQLAVVQVPMSLEQLDKIWTSVEPRLQPWVLYEVAPVQLLARRAAAPPPPRVRPGGLASGVVTIGSRPAIARVVPAPVRPGGRVRIDVSTPIPVDQILAGGVEIPAAGADALLLALDADGLAALGEGPHAIAVRAGGLVSDRDVLRVSSASAPAVDAPAALRHDVTADLVLTGANLDGAAEAIAWPDSGLSSPSDVHSLALSGVSASAVTVPADALQTLPAGRGPWRIAVRVGAHVFTPYVLLEADA